MGSSRTLCRKVIRCAFHLPGHSMEQSKGSPFGVETRLLEEVVMKLNAGSRGDAHLAALPAETRMALMAGYQRKRFMMMLRDMGCGCMNPRHLTRPGIIITIIKPLGD